MSDQEPLKVTLITDLGALETLSMTMRTYEFTVDKGSATERRMAIKIKALTARQVSQLDKLTANLRPPMKKQKGPNGTEIEVYDDQDPEYQARRDAAIQRKQVAYIEAGAPDLKIPGETLEEKVVYLFEHLPTGAIIDVYRAIMQLTADPFSDALFTSTAS